MTTNNSALQCHQPLQIQIQNIAQPLNNDTVSNDAWFVHQSLVSSHPCPTTSADHNIEITTVWQVSVTNPSSQRIAIYAGASTFHSSSSSAQKFDNNSLHVSFRLPPSSHPPSNSTSTPLWKSTAICWANFANMDATHQVLCCLVTTSSLCIWDVYPRAPDPTGNDSVSNNSLPSEGWTISLPFDCRAIYTIPGAGNGILMQRLEDDEDRVVITSMHDDGFFLKDPAHVSKENQQSAEIEPQLHLPTATSNAVPSLFSLHHPLEDILPVVESISHSHHTISVPATDVFERILWVGNATWVDNIGNDTDDGMMTTKNSAVIAVTYHTVLGRHAVWKIDKSMDHSSPPPLYDLIRNQYNCNLSSGFFEAQNDMIMMEGFELLGSLNEQPFVNKLGKVGSPTMLPPRLSRTEALADALGVRRTPRVSVETNKARFNRTSDQHIQHNATSFFSPTAASPVNISSHSSNEFFTTASVSLTDGVESNAPKVQYDVSNLHGNVLGSRISATCLFREPNDSSSPAKSVFIASNIESGSKLVLCLVCQRKSPATRNGNSNELKLLTIHPEKKCQEGKASSLAVHASKDSFPCVTAVPVEATPIPSCFEQNEKLRSKTDSTFMQSRATDILIVDKGGEMILQRSNSMVANVSLGSGLKVLGIENPVQDSFTCICQEGSNGCKEIRGKLSLVPDQNDFVRSLLDIVDSGLSCDLLPQDDGVLVEYSLLRKLLALKVRADVSRLATLSTSGNNNKWLASFCAVIYSVVLFEMSGSNVSNLKRNSTCDDAATSPFLTLLDSQFHRNYASRSPASFLKKVADELHSERIVHGCYEPETTQLSSVKCLSIQHLKSSKARFSVGQLVLVQIFDALHFAYEELKVVSKSHHSERFQLAQLLSNLCRLVKSGSSENAKLATAFLDYYQNDFGEMLLHDELESSTSVKFSAKRSELDLKFSSFDSPPSIFSWIECLLSPWQTRSSAWYHPSRLPFVNASCTRTRSVIKIYSVLFSLSSSTEQSFARDLGCVLLLIEEGFYSAMQVTNCLSPGIAVPILECLERCRRNPRCVESSALPPEAWNLLGRSDIAMNLTNADTFFRSTTPRIASSDEDGLESIEKDASLFYRNDNRVHEAARLLRSSKPIFLRVPRAVEVSDHDFERLKQEKLLLLCFRSLSLSVGRGMLTIDSIRPVPAEPLPLPCLSMKGRVPPTNAILNLDVSECPSDLLVWPEFHNGVAAGLRLHSYTDKAAPGFNVTRTWIVYNRPLSNRSVFEENGTSPNQIASQNGFSHGGFLLALGLRGHLTALEMTDIFDYLTHGTVTTTVGILLGLSANKRGSCDIAVSKMLCLHIPSLIPQHFSAIDVASSVQTAAVMGTGLLFQKSSHRMMTEFLVNEIGKRPDSDISIFDRESYTLACGLALGMVNLAIGEKGGMDRLSGIADLRVDERLYRYIMGGIDSEEYRRTREASDRFSLPLSSVSDNEKCSTIFESDQINTDMTAPGAILALGLMHMKTENNTVASAIALPKTHFLLEFTRPDFLGLRVMARSLILWNSVLPTTKWIAQQIPVVVRNAYEEMRNVAKCAFSSHSSSDRSKHKPDYDRRAMRQIYVHVVAGACFGMGLRYAGTGDENAKAALFERVIELKGLREANDPVSLASRPEFPILDTCLGCAAISLAMVLAGSGDLDALRLFKSLRWRCDKSSSIGSHMVYGMAIGLLFLGGGKCTLGREPEDIAALVIAFFPRFPMSASDNQFHLQALRHLYALATKRKDLRAIDVDSGELVEVPVEIDYVGPLPSKLLMVPSLLHNTDLILRELRVVSIEYYPLTIPLSKKCTSYVFYVKRRRSGPSPLNGIISFFKHSRISADQNACNRFRELHSNSAVTDAMPLPERWTTWNENGDLLQIRMEKMVTPGGRSGKLLLSNLSVLRAYYRERNLIFGSSNTATINVDIFLSCLEEIAEACL